MRAVRGAALLLVVVACPGATGRALWASPAPARSVRVADSQPFLPGGGDILYSIPGGYEVVHADGTRTDLDAPLWYEAFWDPLHAGHVLVVRTGSRKAAVREYEPVGADWPLVDSWPAGESVQISPDGRRIAYQLGGRLAALTTVHVIDRDGGVRSHDVRGLVPASWTPGGAVMLASVFSAGTPATWDPARGALTQWPVSRSLEALVPTAASRSVLDMTSLSWSSEGRFAARVGWHEGRRHHSAIAIGSLTRGVARILVTGDTWGVPTWSPDGRLLAYLVKFGRHPTELHVFDTGANTERLVRSNVPMAWFVAWSPGSDWMLLEDPEPARWWFVSVDGVAVERPSLGSFPRWAGPGPDVHPFFC